MVKVNTMFHKLPLDYTSWLVRSQRYVVETHRRDAFKFIDLLNRDSLNLIPTGGDVCAGPNAL